ncbi:glutamate--tRNA ligase [Lutibaculum baratangense]|uniref:Glutamate--tRNA ligase n=1 Tax=Lutibaculum baratangense AMV1 TaxID=631454 RepID=V4T8P0_9HYPH|nr:glutamate--tRNA ligase [Lutibaculum baratangense]ESR22908.1 Glutamyl-tRNA(Gln) synthetase [Lutibaculum baratangense AMV1]
MTVVRFAPSPTGLLHIGNARTALLNWLFAKGRGGRFVLRLDDTDQARSREEYAEQIIEDLAWLGIEPDLVVRQSERLDRYDEAARRLRGDGRLYGCYETPDELERRRKLRLAQGLPPVYDRSGLSLGPEERERLAEEGRRPHWRFLLRERRVEWDDLCRGPQHVETTALSDPVLVREDGTYLYTLPSVVDDIDLGITHVIRGEDHVTNTGVQIELFEALGSVPPGFAHHNLLIAGSGEALSKRTGALSLKSLREAGYEPAAVASLAVLLGSAEAVEARPDLASLARELDLMRLSRAPARFDEAELEGLNRSLIREMDYKTAKARLASVGADLGERFWLAVRGNLDRVRDAIIWRDVIEGPVEPPPPDREFLDVAARELPPEPWDDGTWSSWTGALKAQTGRKGKDLFMPLRLALTGREHGPELRAFLPLLGRERVEARLRKR